MTKETGPTSYLLFGVKLDFCTSDEIDSDLEAGVSGEEAYGRHIVRSMNRSIPEGEKATRWLEKNRGLSLVWVGSELYLCVASSVRFTRGPLASVAFEAFKVPEWAEEHLEDAVYYIENSDTKAQWHLLCAA
jgi:hypothetical protein